MFRLRTPLFCSLVLPILFASAIFPLSATTGVLRITVRDVDTHYALQANVSLDGPQRLSVQTDATGRVTLTLAPGEYRIEVTASGHKLQRTHYNVMPGANLPGTIMLDPESLQEEERPEVIDAEIRPGFTLFHGYTVDGDTGQPLSGVSVRFVQADVETQTDSKGHYMLSVPTPEPINPGGAGTDTLTFEKLGYKTVVFDNFAISGEAMGGIGLDLERGSGVIKQDATHKMMRGQIYNPEEPQSATAAMSISRELYNWLGAPGASFPIGTTASIAAPAVITVPSTIRVGTGGSSTTSYQPCSGKTTCTNWFSYSLESYVTQGLPGEWLASWVSDSLKAGAVAYRSYGAYFVANPVDPNDNYDICNTTACQLYDPWDFPSNKTSKAAATGTSGVVLSADGLNVFQAEYAAESNLASDTNYATCPDGQVGEPANNWPCMSDPIDIGKSQSNTHSRGMCQRGSQRWASGKDSTGAPGDTGATLTTPRDWRCILDHYYNASSNSVTVDPTGTGNPGAGSGLRTAFMQGQPTYGLVAYEAYNSSGVENGIRAANAADGSGDYLIVAGQNWEPSWEPGGGRLAYTDSAGIAVINADGTGQVQLTSYACGQPQNRNCDFAPSWSPFSGKIAFCSYRSGTTQIWEMNPDGSNLQQLTTDLNLQDAGLLGGNAYEQENCNLRWKPDETAITFTGGTGPYNVYTANLDGSGVAQLTSCLQNNPMYVSACFTPAWSPDGTRIVFSDDDTNFGDNIGGAGIYTMNSDGSNVTPVYQIESSHNWWPRWSTDGKKIFDSADPSVGPWGIWSMNPDGTGRTQIIGTGKYYTPESFDCSVCKNFGTL